MGIEEVLYKDWEQQHIKSGKAHLLTPHRAYMAGHSEGLKNEQFAGAMVTRVTHLAERMRVVIAQLPQPTSPATRNDIAELDTDLRDWIEHPCTEWQRARGKA